MHPNTRVTNGISGGLVISDTSAHVNAGQDWIALQALTDVVIATVSNTNVNGLTGLTLPQGTIIFGRFNGITLTSGTLLAYNNH